MTELIINAKEHVCGKLATYVAEQIHKYKNDVIVINCEQLIQTGPIQRGEKKFKSFLNKQRITNPLKGQKHHREPMMYFKRVVSRMVPKKTIQGKASIARLTTYDGCPSIYETMTHYKIPEFLHKYTNDPRRKSYMIGDMLKKYGWKRSEEISKQNKLSEERIEKFVAEENAKITKIEEFKKSGEFKKQVAEQLAKFE